MSDTAAIVLAAGLSRRMGDLNKLLLHVGEDILLTHVVSACAAATDHPVTVVTGHQAQAVIDALAPAAVNVVHNRQFEEGQMTSVDAGLRGAPEAEDLSHRFRRSGLTHGGRSQGAFGRTSCSGRWADHSAHGGRYSGQSNCRARSPTRSHLGGPG